MVLFIYLSESKDAQFGRCKMFFKQFCAGAQTIRPPLFQSLLGNQILHLVLTQWRPSIACWLIMRARTLSFRFLECLTNLMHTNAQKLGNFLFRKEGKIIWLGMFASITKQLNDFFHVWFFLIFAVKTSRSDLIKKSIKL